MQKRTKNITLLFIWHTGLMFFMHGITPHHHHFDSLYSHHDDSDNDSEDSPYHCHAFNDLVIDKTASSLEKAATDKLPVSGITESDSHLHLFAGTPGKLYNSHIVKSPDQEAFLKHTPTRGSPALV